MKIICSQCNKKTYKRKSYTENKRGNPYTHSFCSMTCYNTWRKNRFNEIARNTLKFKREVWGTLPIERFKPANSRKLGRFAEILARDVYLPKEGFTEIVDMSGYSNQFFFDFIATFKGERVLVDATVKLKASVKEKVETAVALRMKLFLIHVAAKNNGLYYLHEVPLTQTTFRVPMKFIRKHYNIG